MFLIFIFLVRASCESLLINTAEELIELSEIVNSGAARYFGTTVFLGADIDFSGNISGRFKPIGKDCYDFQGMFDGQGHTVSNLEVCSSSLNQVGLFGHSSGVIIRNVILDSSCSVVSSYNGSDWAYVG